MQQDIRKYKWWVSEIREAIYDQNEKFSTEKEIIKNRKKNKANHVAK
jgi:hypothetical protein